MEKEPISTRLLVKNVMNSPPITASSDASIQELAKLMRDNYVGSVIITDKGNVVGIVSEKDIVTKAVTKDELPSKIKAEEIMEKVIGIESEESITKAARLFRKYNTKRLAVFYKGTLTGVISASDVIAIMPELVDVISEKAGIIRGDIIRREVFVSGYCDDCEEWSDYLQYVDGKYLCEECREGIVM